MTSTYDGETEPGELFGHYRLIRRVGNGGMGEVWKAVDPTEGGREVALKLLLPHYSDLPEFRARFEQEAILAARLAEPHSVPVHKTGEIDRRLFIDMRWIDGRTATSALPSAGFDPARAVEIIRSVASALEAAHRLKLLHRDVKPSNIMITSDDFVYLIDFGLGRSIDAHTSGGLTRPGDLWGSPGYIPPERLAGEPDTVRGDVYSLACVLFELLTGTKAFSGADIGGRRPRPHSLRPAVPRQFDNVLALGLAHDPAHRPASALTLSEMAERALRDSFRRRRTDAQPKTHPPDGRAQGGGKSHPRGPIGDNEPPRTRDEPPRTRPDPLAAHRDREAPPRPSVSRPPGRPRLLPGVIGVTAAFVLAGIVYLATQGIPSSGTPTPAVVPAIRVGAAPDSLAVAPDGETLVVSDPQDGTANVIDLAERRVTAEIRVGTDPRAVAIDATGRRAYIANAGTGTVSVVDLRSRTVTASIPVGDRPTALALQGNGARLFVGNEQSADVAVVDTRSNAVVDTISVGFMPWTTIEGLAVDDAGRTVLVTVDSSLQSDTVAVLDIGEGRTRGEIPVGETPQGVAISSDGRLGYVADQDSGTVTVVDVGNLAVVTTVAVGGSPSGVVAHGGRIYVAGSDSGAAALDVRTNRPLPVLTGTGEMTAIAIAPDGRSAFLLSPESPELTEVDLS